ncbi:MAG: hypothetical protein GY748_18585 [Planctomycetaceae bacterium]|nr:hypothetical protein [Planctomycetaceae bacterium]
MNASRNVPQQKVSSLILIGALIGFAVAIIVPFMMEGKAEASSTISSVGQHQEAVSVVKDVVVSYTYETSSSSSAGNSALAADSIEFHPTYVLVHATSGDTFLFPVERLQQFRFRPSTSK